MDTVIDFDGTVVTHDYSNIGKDIGAVSVLKELVTAGHRLILFTMRSKGIKGDLLTDAVNWLKSAIFLCLAFSETLIRTVGQHRQKHTGG